MNSIHRFRSICIRVIPLSFVVIGLTVLQADAHQGNPGVGGGAVGGELRNLPTGDLVIPGDGVYPLTNHNELVSKLSCANLEQTQDFAFELSGQTSVHLKFKKEGGPSGTFVTRNESCNPNTEIAYFNLARILGVEKIFRATVPYTLHSRAMNVFKTIIQNTPLRGMRAKNANNILAAMGNDSDEMRGAIKEKKRGKDVTLDSLANVESNSPALNHPLFQDLKASNPKPTDASRYEFRERYWAPRAKIARQFSLMMTMDTVFGQWDRYSGSNVVFRLVDENTKEVEVYSTDNGGADFWNTTKWSERQASWFSRYDRQAIEGLKAVYSFLTGRASSLRSERLGRTWTAPNAFVTELGLYYEKRPSQYVSEISKNIAVLLKAVDANYARYGEAIFF